MRILEEQRNRINSLLVLILSFDGEPYSSIQAEGQDKTFVSRAITNSTVIRYVGQSLKLDHRFRAILLIRRFQYFLLSHSKSVVVQKLLIFLAGLKFLDEQFRDAIEASKKKSGARKTHIAIRRDSLVGTIVTATPEGWAFVGIKTIEALKFTLQNYDFDFLFRTNTSSYLDTERLLEYLENLPQTGVYSGVVGTVMGDLEFASGAGILMSRDVVKRVCEQAESWNHSLIDDAALGELIKGFRDPAISLTPLNRLTFPTLKYAIHADPIEVRKSFHIRCKSRSPAETKRIMLHVASVKGDI